MRKLEKIYDLNRIALTASIYFALCYLFQPISFGPVQFRISEILCLLTIDFRWALFGVSIGCFLSNMFIGGLGAIDIIFGTSATVIGCSLAYLLRDRRIKGYPILSVCMIVLVNALIIGTELGFILETKEMIPIYIIQVGIGESVVSFLGLPLYQKLVKRISERDKNRS